jgi:hypothetical protein
VYAIKIAYGDKCPPEISRYVFNTVKNYHNCLSTSLSA